MTPHVAVALLSGAPALIYQVVWTREVALLAGSQVEAISAVLVAFFGGLALGARVLGGAADRVASPWRLYAGLEIGAGLAAAGSVPLLRAFGRDADVTGAAALLLAGATILPVTFMLGGTLPALLRDAARANAQIAARAGAIVGANTLGSVLGVALAVRLIPELGLRLTCWAAAAGSISIGLGALVLARRPLRAAPPGGAAAPAAAARAPLDPAALAVALLAGVATLAFEVLTARLAALRIGSSLLAWAWVLGLFLAGLGLGNLAFGARAARTPRPGHELGLLELAAAGAIALALPALAPPPTAPALGLTLRTLLEVAALSVPAAFLMGGAFPYFVRLAVGAERVGRRFGAVSAANTAGGIAGALIAPFVLIPGIGPAAGALACAALDAALGAFLLVRFARGSRLLPLGAAAAGLALAVAVSTLWRSDEGEAGHAIFVGHGRQATAVVVHARGQRDLIVDGDPEASTGSAPRRTEVLLAALPLALHPQPERFLEVGLGSGITLGTAARFPLERVDCVEIASAVIAASRFFAPDNGGVTLGSDRRVRIFRADGRAFLARHPGEYDVVAANTLHPWSVGATGLYSHEYFARVARALRPGGIAVQWLPAERIGADSLELILRTWFDVFEYGGLWWGANNLIAVGSGSPLPELDLPRSEARLAGAGLHPDAFGPAAGARGLAERRIARAASVREALGRSPVLHDDRPQLELAAAQRAGSDAALLASLVAIAEAELRRAPERGAQLLMLQSRAARAAGDAARADGREALAEQAGLRLARDERIQRRAQAGLAELEAGHREAAAEIFDAVLAEEPLARDARLGRAFVALRGAQPRRAVGDLESLLARDPADAPAWQLLATARQQLGDTVGARAALDRALLRDPYSPDALANAGLAALRDGDRAHATSFLERLRALSPTGRSHPEQALRQALSDAP